MRLLLAWVLMSSFLSPTSGADVLTLDDGEASPTTWQARADGKIATIEVHQTFSQRKLGDGCQSATFLKPKDGWCSIGRPLTGDWTTFTCLRFWIKLYGVKELEIRLTDGGKENFITKVTAKADGQWQYESLPFASFVRNKGYQAMGASEDGKLDLDKIADLNISPLGTGGGRIFLDQVDVAILADAAPAGGVPPEPPPGKFFELDAPLTKKTATVDIDGDRLGGRISRYLTAGWGDDAGEFADNPEWNEVVKTAGLPLLRINARLDRYGKTGGYDTTALERDLAALKALGTHAMVVIDATPPALGKSRDNPTDAAAWAEMAGAIVKRINGELKLEVPVWQIWSEADSKTAWTGKPEEFAALAARAAERMKAADPAITVLVGGFARPSAVRELGQSLIGTDSSGSIDGLAWTSFALEKVADGGAADALDRTWSFERPFIEVAQIARTTGRPLLTATALRPAAETKVYNPRLDSVFTPVYFASAFNHLARQNAFLGCWQTATIQRLAGLLDGKGRPRPLVKLLHRLNEQLHERDWFWIDCDSSTAAVETLAAVSGDRFLLMLVNKDANGAQHDTTVKIEKLKLAGGTVWTLGRGADGSEEKPLPAGAPKLLLPPMSVTLITGALAEPVVTPDHPPEGLSPVGRTPIIVRWVDKAKGWLVGEDKDGKAVSVITGALKPEPGKEAKAPKPAKVDKADKEELPAVAAPKNAFVPGMKLDVSGKKKGTLIVAEKCVLQGETVSIPRPSDSGFNLAERIKGRQTLTAERIKPGFDPARVLDLPIKPALIWTTKQVQGDSKKAVTNDADFSAKIRLAWNEENLYVVATVQDETLITADPPSKWSLGDSLVVGFDMGFDSPPGDNDDNDTEIIGYIKNGKGQGLTLINPANRKGGSFNDGVRFAQPSKDGYQMALIIPWQTLGFVPETGRTFGFNLVLNESDKEKTRDGWYEWAKGMSNVTLPLQDFTQFGILELR